MIPVSTGFRFQPVDADEVAARLVELAVGDPAGLAPDLGGPTAYGMDELVHSYLLGSGRREDFLAQSVSGRPGTDHLADATDRGRPAGQIAKSHRC